MQGGNSPPVTDMKHCNQAQPLSGIIRLEQVASLDAVGDS